MNADPIARIYRLGEYLAFGPILWRARIHYLSHLAAARHILILGEGDGRFLAALLAINKHATIDIYDNSRAMLTLARQRAGAHQDRCTFHHADIRTASLPIAHYDALIANFVFDVFPTDELPLLLTNLTQAAQPLALFYVTDFTRDNALTRILYKLFATLTGLTTRRLPAINHSLHQSGLTLTHEHQHCFGQLASQLWRQPCNARHRASPLVGFSPSALGSVHLASTPP
jgi:ubiquinone/menaquinone biosynthesis C-methylase UbiE